MSLTYTSLPAAEKAAQDLNTLRVLSTETHVKKEEAPPPYTTLALLDDTAEKLAWSGERSMAVAQSLFEQGLITYPRSDSIHISPEATELARQIVRERYGFTALKGFSLGASLLRAPAPPTGAHEAIRPANPMQFPEHQAGLLLDQAALYKLIWERFIASQMQAARYQVIEVELESA
jgi:DNA topoisomerase I